MVLDPSAWVADASGTLAKDKDGQVLVRGKYEPPDVTKTTTAIAEKATKKKAG